MVWQLKKKPSESKENLQESTLTVKQIKPIKLIKPIRPVKPVAPTGYEYCWKP